MQEYSQCKDFVKHLWFVAFGLVGFIFYHQQGIQLESRMVCIYIYIYIHLHMYMHVYHVYMYKASPLHIGTRAVIILCASFLWNSPKFLLKSCSTGTWTQTPTCMYMYACVYIYTFVFFHMHACTQCTWYIHTYIYICCIPICKHCAILKVGI